MWGEHVYCEGHGRVAEPVARLAHSIAAVYGAYFHCRDIPGEGWRYWFTMRGGGQTANRLVEQAIRADLAANGLDINRLAK